MCRYSHDRREIEGEDKENQEPNKKHAIKPSTELGVDWNCKMLRIWTILRLIHRKWHTKLHLCLRVLIHET